MDFKMLPTQLWLLQLTDERIRTLRPVTSLDIFDGATQNFHEDGLYSTTIFGRIGTEERDQRFSYIDIKARIFHPKIFRDLCALKGLYRGILSGKETAIFDETLKDFVADKGPNGQTGYSFFVKHFDQLVLRKNKSPARQQRVDLIEKFRHQCFMTRVPVLPAGYRDYEVSDTGRATKNEINDLYYRLLSISNNIVKTRDMEVGGPLDISRYSLTMTVSAIYETIEAMVEGKRGFMLNKWGSRRIFNATRNVLSVMDTSSDVLGAKNAPGFDATTVGLYQTIKGLTPLTIHLLRNSYLANVFSEGENYVPLVDKRTLTQELVSIPPEVRDTWTTKEGLLKVINSYADIEARHRPVEVEGRYLALIYRGPDMSFRVFNDIRELPASFDRKYVGPISLVELLYLSGYRRWNQYYVSVTRYPVTGIDSNYPSRVYVKTTTVGEVRRELGPDWLPLGEDHVAYEYPKRELASFMDSQSPHSSRLTGLGADFDGDTGSGTYLMTDEALEENRRFLSSTQAWVSSEGGLRASASYDTLELVTRNLTGRYDYGQHASEPAVLQALRNQAA